jgi:diguanylate cyclase
VPGWWLSTLRSRLLLSIGLGWGLLVIALLGYSHVTGSALAQRESLSRLADETELVADLLAQAIHQRQQALAWLGPSLSPADPALATRLQGQQGLLALFDRLMVFDAEGEPLAAWPAFEHGGPNIAGRDYFRHVQGFRRPHVSEPYVEEESGTPRILVIEPLLDDQGRFLGILGGNLSLHDSDAFLDPLRHFGDPGHVLLVNAAGRIISHPDRERLMQPVPDTERLALLDLALDGWEGSGVGEQLDGQPALMAFRQVWPAGWVVGGFQPLSQVQAPIQRYTRELRWVGLATLVLMLPLLWWLLGQALAPLYRLERQIEGVARGEAERLTLPTSLHELRQVAEAFNRLEARRREALASREAREAFLQAVLASSPVGMFLADMSGRVNYVNPALEAISGFNPAGRRRSEWVRHVHAADRREFVERWRRTLQSGEQAPHRYRFQRDDGSLLWLEVQASRVELGEIPLGFVGLVQDITERHERETRQRWEAEHDPLTGCLNRRGFELRLEEACTRHRRESDLTLSLILLDLDHFKLVNDTAGHGAGDVLLKRIGSLLQEAVRQQDAVARLGGDEFALLLPACPLRQAREIAERVRERIAQLDLRVDGQRLRVTASLGVSRLERQDCDGMALVKRADRASYHAKRQGRNRVVVQDEPTIVPM